MRDLMAELHEEQCAHGGTLREVDRLRDENRKLRGLLARCYPALSHYSHPALSREVFQAAFCDDPESS